MNGMDGPCGNIPNRLIDTDWWPLLEAELGSLELRRVVDRVERQDASCLPPPELVFRALQMTPCSETKVVIVGQDPYFSPGQAQGLAFSVPEGFRPLPPSLRSILRELESDGFTHDGEGDLERWACEGVLLLNTSLTVDRGRPASRLREWRSFTDAVIRVVARERPIFVLWGAKAQGKSRTIIEANASEAKIVKSSHPAPPACYRCCGDSPSFRGSSPFRETNRLLRESGRDEIDWNL
jgi:uracil-DNA glycosylase